jgi:hypothetical protein
MTVPDWGMARAASREPRRPMQAVRNAGLTQVQHPGHPYDLMAPGARSSPPRRGPEPSSMQRSRAGLRAHRRWL